MDKKNIIERAKELDKQSQNFTLSHAVFATAKMIEEVDIVSKEISDNDFLSLFSKQKGNLKKIKKGEIDFRLKRENRKVYISVGHLSSQSKTESARTFVFTNKICPTKESIIGEVCREKEDTEISYAECFEILLPPKEFEVPIVEHKNGQLSRKSLRFLVGHELGHLWLHLDDVRNIIEMSGTNYLSVEKEQQADIFSFELSKLREEHLVARSKP